MFLLNLIRKLYKVLSTDSSPSGVAFALAFGLTAGCVPLASGCAILFILLILVFRVQISAAILAWGIGRLLTLSGGAALFERFGESLLEAEGARSFWTWFLNLPGVAWLGLDVYAILGGLAAGLAAGALLFLPVRYLIIAYRRWAHEKVSKNRFFRWLTSFWFVKLLRFIFIGAKA